MKKIKTYWLDKPQNHDYPAAGSYLRLLFSDEAAEQMVSRLRVAPVVSFYAKDILRASGLKLEMVGKENRHVRKNLSKIKKGIELSPILLVRHNGGGVIIADGFHRACAVYLYNEDAEIPCKIADGDVVVVS